LAKAITKRVKGLSCGVRKIADADPKLATKLVTFRALYDYLLGHVPDVAGKNKTILDFGVGCLGYCSMYAPDFGRAIGLDVRDVSKYNSGIECIVGDGHSIPLPDRSVDLIVSHSVIEHVEDLDSAFSEMNRVLKVKGYAYLTVSPLYFSHRGSHDKTMDDWEHSIPKTSGSWGRRRTFASGADGCISMA
jgi:SAM-dependent methyltransferase